MTSSSTSDQPSSTSSTDQPGTQTLAYYDENARTFSDSTVNVEFSSMHERFEALLSPRRKDPGLRLRLWPRCQALRGRRLSGDGH